MTGVQTCALPILGQGEAALSAGALDWIGLALVAVVIPAVVSWLVSELMRKQGLIKEGDYKLDL